MRDPNVGDTLDGYELTELLARGGMATIFKAVDLELGKTVALKVPHIQYESDVVFYERFCREEEAAQRVDHPNVVKAFSPRREKSRMYMVLEYVDGVPLSSVLLDGRALPTAQAIDIARQICDALAYLHAQGIFHRDVKPGNVLLTPSGQVKILDFGIAHIAAARRLTISGLSASFGTPCYMAPEQMLGRVGDGRVDVYALGTMLYQMLTGRLPYCGDDWETLLRAKRLDDPTPPSAHVPDIDPALEAIIMRAIEPVPADRYATAVDMLADLRNPSAVPPRDPATSRAQPRHRRNLRPLAAVLVVVAALCGIGWIARLSHRRAVESIAATADQRAPGVAQREPARSASGHGSAQP
jgi:eukaryotic-like serine/threonine-protein kinase